jgi:extradiol dioxygenase family protein
VQPILHLSLPVRDLRESRRFYADVLGCEVGRERPEFVDIWFHGLQLTLQERPGELLDDTQRGVRHFGVTLDRATLAALLDEIARHPVHWVEPLHTDFAGTALEQTKAKLTDPSGNVIELKSYADPAAALGAP